MSGQKERADLFRRAVLWLQTKGGEEAVVWAFGDPGSLDATWALELPKFKEDLRSRMKEALGGWEGGA